MADSGIQPQPVAKPDKDDSAGGARALQLLSAVHNAQAGLSGAPALAWERAAFRAAFLDPEPGQRIRAFLSGQRPED